MGYLQNNYFSDSFQDPPFGNLSSNWYIPEGSFELSDGFALPTGTFNLAVCPLNSNSVTVSLQIQPIGGPAGVVGRWNGSTGYVAVLNSATSLVLGIVNSAGDFTSLASVASSAIAGVISLTINSSQLTLQFNGVEVLSILDTTIVQPGSSGMVAVGEAVLVYFSASAPLENGGSCCQ